MFQNPFSVDPFSGSQSTALQASLDHCNRQVYDLDQELKQARLRLEQYQSRESSTSHSKIPIPPPLPNFVTRTGPLPPIPSPTVKRLRLANKSPAFDDVVLELKKSRKLKPVGERVLKTVKSTKSPRDLFLDEVKSGKQLRRVKYGTSSKKKKRSTRIIRRRI